jgi:hypothetical protein
VGEFGGGCRIAGRVGSSSYSKGYLALHVSTDKRVMLNQMRCVW